MQQSEHTRDHTTEKTGSGLLGLISRFGEEVCAEPEHLESKLEEMVSGVAEVLGLRCVGLSVELSEKRRISVEMGEQSRDGSEKFPVMRGKVRVGELFASAGASANSDGGEPLTEKQADGLRTAAASCALAVDAAHAREVASVRAAHGSLVQLASEALGTITDEDQLHKTVLVLTLELLEATGGIVFLEDGGVVSIGEIGESVRELEQVETPARKPWIGRVGRFHALGVPVGRSAGSLFVVRKERPYTENEGVSLKLVARQLARAEERSRLYASLETTTRDAIASLAAALESRDGTTGEHILRAQKLTGEVARALGLDPDTVQTTEYAAILHDVGKIGIPDAILNKPGKLDEREWATMRLHPQMGVDILSRISGFERVSDAVLNHHERYGGGGYPLGSSGYEIPVEARIISVVDSYDAMTNDRPYRKAMGEEEALEELAAGSGSQFDPEVVEALRKVLKEKRERNE